MPLTTAVRSGRGSRQVGAASSAGAARVGAEEPAEVRRVLLLRVDRRVTPTPNGRYRHVREGRGRRPPRRARPPARSVLPQGTAEREERVQPPPPRTPLRDPAPSRSRDPVRPEPDTRRVAALREDPVPHGAPHNGSTPSFRAPRPARRSCSCRSSGAAPPAPGRARLRPRAAHQETVGVELERIGSVSASASPHRRTRPLQAGSGPVLPFVRTAW